MDWLGDYSTFQNVIIGVNAPRMKREIAMYLKHKNNWTDAHTNAKVIYLPNYYPQDFKHKTFDKKKDTVDVACFGAVRPLKNHLVQAFAAIDFAEQIGKKLRFHINAGRIEMQGGPVINNMKGLFQQIHGRGHELVNHQWRPREQFLELCAEMDIGMQVSFSETFNIVSADMVSQGVPFIGTSEEIPWAIDMFCANPVNTEDIVKKLKLAYRLPRLNVWANQLSLKQYTKNTAKIWAKYFG
jgi:hypothetical protein